MNDNLFGTLGKVTLGALEFEKWLLQTETADRAVTHAMFERFVLTHINNLELADD